MAPTLPLTIDTIAVGSPPEPGSEVPTFVRSSREVTKLAPHEVLVRILCTGVCHSDFMLFERPGAVPGHEAIGVVEALGSPGITEELGIKVGDRVGMGYAAGSCGSCRECDDGYEQLCEDLIDYGSMPNGGYASYVTWDAKFAFPIPDALPSAYAGPLLCAGATVYGAIAESGVREGGTVGVVGIGGLGHMAIKFARALGYEVVALTRSPGKEEEVRKFGADKILITSDDEAMRDARKSIDVLVSTVPGTLDWGTYLELVRPRGRAVLVGITSKPHSIPGDPIILGQRSFGGSMIAGRKRMKEMLSLAAEKKVWPTIECYPLTLDGVNEAVKSVAENTVRYRAVLVADGCDGVPQDP